MSEVPLYSLDISAFDEVERVCLDIAVAGLWFGGLGFGCRNGIFRFGVGE